MNPFELGERAKKPGLVARLMWVSVYTSLACGIAWRAWSYDLGTGTQPYPVLPMFLCACLIAVLYTLSIVTLAGRSAVLAAAVVGETGDSTH